ncbi:AraC family transcriptional regulator [Sphingobium subterraneum]|uniref:AraC-like DNA-binding protein n=1 Tax=Sphingobium subterraneum TaxID=627688 RepID=A0A841JAR6_9SPHN|nr:AraC family transcriptional regulator [Sphingobium subterraneum]MBB6125231.1 AraC-like DNA-binding protein [Sphingobium subterraneum]
MNYTSAQDISGSTKTDVLSDLLSLIRIDGSVLSEVRCGGEWGIDMESGNGVPFHYVTEGECWLISNEKPRKLSKGDMVIAMHWPRHALSSSPNGPLLTARELVARNEMTFWTGGTLDRPNILQAGTEEKDVSILSGIFSLNGRGAKLLIDQLPSMMHLQVEEQHLAPELKMALDFIHYESQIKRPGYIAVASRLMDLLFIQVLRSAISQPDVSIGLLAGLVDPNISRTLSAIHAAPSHHWTVASLAREAGMSRTGFAERFRQVIGVTPIQYLTRWRMTIAEDLLVQSNETIEHIRTRLGYDSGFVFARAFRAHSGVSPREYRIARRQAD